MTSHQVTPYYAPAGEDQSQYNPQRYYNNYSYAPNQAPPHPDGSVAYNNSYYAQQQAPPSHAGGPIGVDTRFASPPAPTMQDIYTEFGTSPAANPSPLSYSDNGSFDLLDDTPAPQVTSRGLTPHYNDLQTATLLAAQEGSNGTTSTSRAIVSADDIPSEIVAAQERALAECKQRQMTRHNNDTIRTLANVREMQIPESDNPTGSDAVHPDRPAWKRNRGGKTIAGTAGGALVGGLIFGPAFPVGIVLGGAAGGYATNKLSKQGERRAQRKWEQANFQRGADRSITATSHRTMV